MPRRHVETRITLDAPPDRVYAVLADLAAYPSWNRVLNLGNPAGGAQEGARAWLRVKGSPLPIPVRFEVAAPGRELRWTGGPPLLMRGSHYFELHELPPSVAGGPARTEVVHAEEFRGLFVPLMWPLMLPQLERLYSAVNEGLAEAVARAAE